MKPDIYTKTILTIISTCLLIQVLQNNITPKVQAGNKNHPSVALPKGFALVPVNSDGSIKVSISQPNEPQDVIVIGYRDRYDWITGGGEFRNLDSFDPNSGIPVVTQRRP